jgi:hypothetical protein
MDLPMNLKPNVAVLPAVLLFVAACTQLTQGYQVTSRTSRHFPATETVHIIEEEPGHPYEILAEFIGHEPVQCPDRETLCTLRGYGERLGADAAWIQEHIKTEHPGDWIQVNDKMTKIHPYTTETYRGVFIRYLTE